MPTTSTDLYPPGWLSAGGVVVIPLALTLAPDTSVLENLDESWEDGRSLLHELQGLPDRMPVRYDLSELAGREQFADGTVGELRAILQRGPFTGGDEQVIGASVRIAGISVARVRYALRNPTNYASILEGALGSGSCPIVYTSDAGREVWVRRGEILRERQGKAREGSSEMRIPAFPLRIRIAEEEPETSVIDQVYLRGLDEQGRDVVFRAKDARLQHADGRYLVLRQGERIEVEFEVSAGRQLSRVRLGAAGYFVRH